MEKVAWPGIFMLHGGKKQDVHDTERNALLCVVLFWEDGAFFPDETKNNVDVCPAHL